MTEAATYPSELDSLVGLPNRRLLHIRALRQCEMEPVRAFYARLSARSRYLRFFSPMPVLSDSMLRLITCGDYRRRLALVGELILPNATDLVALANFGANDEGAAEVGLVVGDEWQRQGIGTALATRMMDAAEARGFDRFVAHVLWENHAVVRKLIGRLGDVVSATMDYGVARMTFVRNVPLTASGRPAV
jgi:RimJ/RimL family protein N-acetyltransferase